MNTPSSVSVPASGFVTVTLRPPAVAPAGTATDTVIVVEFTTVGEPTVNAEPENDTDAPATKFVPMIVTDTLAEF